MGAICYPLGMALTLYNTLTRRKEPFEPLDPQNVRMYVCGPTVYDFAHIGNARAVVAFDLLYRVLRHTYGKDHVRYVRNITDVEDKIIAAARDNGEAIDALTRRTTAIFHEDMAALGNLSPDIEPRATEYIAQMIAMIERLIGSGHAYAAQGHALFRVASYAEYGALSRRSRADLIAGARVEVAPYKEDPGDFVLWKPSSPDQPGWDSPWGRGRPGWHIECSAMSENTLGRDLRHPRRRARPDLSAPRERDRAERVRPCRAPLCALLDAQRHADRRRRQDGEVRRQFRHRARRARRLRRAR